MARAAYIAAVHPAGPLPRMMTLECLAGILGSMTMEGSAAFAGLVMSYRNRNTQNQAGDKAMPVHKFGAGRPGPAGRAGGPVFEKYYCAVSGRAV
jgi:hypothetical protein